MVSAAAQESADRLTWRAATFEPLWFQELTGLPRPLDRAPKGKIHRRRVGTAASVHSARLVAIREKHLRSGFFGLE